MGGNISEQCLPKPLTQKSRGYASFPIVSQISQEYGGTTGPEQTCIWFTVALRLHTICSEVKLLYYIFEVRHINRTVRLHTAKIQDFGI